MDSGIETAHRFFEGTGRSYNLIVNLCTLGFDLYWKERILRKIPRSALHVVDQACGTGILTFKIARRFPSCRVTGVELRDEYLKIARAQARALKLKNTGFVLGRAEDVLVEGPVDCITSSYLAKYAELKILILNAQAMLRPGGIFVMHDFTYPAGSLFGRTWELYFKILQSAGTACFHEWKTVFFELPEFLKQSTWLSDVVEELKAMRFAHIKIESLTRGTAAIVTAVRV